MEVILGKNINSGFYPTVSVIVPIYNGAKDLPDLIYSLTAQIYPSDRVEFLLVDNASQDNTPSMIQQAMVEAADNFVIRHLTESKIKSSYAARNAGILASTGEILTFTDVDCRPQADWLYQLVQPFTDERVGAVGGAIQPLPGESLLERYAAHEQVLSQEHHLSTQFLPFAATANLAIRRQALVDIGLFRSHLTTGGDADLCWRLQKHSPWELCYASAAVTYHRHRTSLKGLLLQYHRYGRAMGYLDELYGIEILPETKWNTLKYLRSWKHWLFKELPPITPKILKGETSVLELWMSPITILVQQAFAIGRMAAKLPEEAKKIQTFS
jgi:cellulose synthase/poly-beta-1,6-N-acetylglucosamine synthase-like glycosyltransferase